MSIIGRVKQKILWVKLNKYRTLLRASNKNLSIYGPLIIKKPEMITIGENCKFNDYVFLHGGGGLVIEDNVTLSAYSKIFTYGYDIENWKENYLSKKHIGSSVHIGYGAWIGAGALILPGVKITGRGVIVASGSVVTKSFHEDFILIGGNPAKVIKRYI